MRQVVDSDAIFKAAINAMGGTDAVRNVYSIRAFAECTSPRGPYTTEIHSARGDRLWFKQSNPERDDFVATINGRCVWTIDPSTQQAEELPVHVRSMLRGHEFQLIPLILEERFRDPLLEDTEEFAGSMCTKMRVLDDMDQMMKHCSLCRSNCFAMRDDMRIENNGMTNALVCASAICSFVSITVSIPGASETSRSCPVKRM